MYRRAARTGPASLALTAVVAVAATGLILLAAVPGGTAAHAEVADFALTEPVYDLGADSDVEFSFTGKIQADSSGPVHVVLYRGNNNLGILSDPTVGADRVFVSPSRKVSDLFTAQGQYTAVAFTDNQKQENGTSINLEFRNNLLYMEPDFEIELSAIPDKTAREGEQVSFRVTVTDGSLDGVKYRLTGAVQQGAQIDPDTGLFTWTPGEGMGTATGARYTFDVSASKVPLSDTSRFAVMVSKPAQAEPEPKEEQDEPPTLPSTSTATSSAPKPTLEIPASFVDPGVDPQTYVDRYNNHESFKSWFDENYSQYDSIYHAVNLPDPLATNDAPASEPLPPPTTALNMDVAPFVDPSEDPQSYVERYNTDAAYKQWFDNNYAQEYGTIYDAVGLPTVPAEFVDPSEDPQFYVDRYNIEESYRTWFDENYSQYDSIYHAVGLPEPGDAAEPEPTGVPEPEPEPEPELPPPVIAPGAVVPPGLVLENGQEFGECGEGTELVDDYCVIIGTEPPVSASSAGETDGTGAASSGSGLGGGCLIATAAYGSELAPQVQMLREIRDTNLMQTGAGASFIGAFNSAYYSFSPYVADAERENPVLRHMIKNLLTPMLHTLSIMEDADTEHKVITYGLLIILANVVMYVGVSILHASLAHRYWTRMIAHSMGQKREQI